MQPDGGYGKAATIYVSCDGSEPLLLLCSAPVLKELQAQVAVAFQDRSNLSSALSIRLVWRHKTGETHISDDAAFAKAWQASGCDRGGSLSLHVCRNQDQLSQAPLENRTCAQCGQEFSSRNQLMRHVQSLAHYGNEEKSEGVRQGMAELQDRCDVKELVPLGKGQGRCKAWELYYQDLDDFQQISSLMQTAVPYCFRSVPTSPLWELAMKNLNAEATLRRPQGLAFDGAACNCWALTSDESWNLLQAAQDCGAIQRQEAASMVPVMLLQVEPHHFVADLCAAPASKTLQLLDLMAGSPGDVSPGLLVVNDDSWSRCATALRRSHQHANPSPLMWLCGDAREFPTLHDHSDGRVRGARKIRFDRVLCDVPCSGDGRLRRSPSGWASWHPRYMLQMHYVQSAILKRGLTILKPAGLLLYSTCSMSPIENEAVVAAALEKFGPDQVRLVPVEEWSHAKGLSTWRVPAPDFASEPHLSFGTQEEVSEHSESLWCRNGGPLAPTMFPPCNPEARAALSHCIRISPTHGDFGGFFCALFEKVAPGPATLPPRLLDSTEGSKATGMKRDKEVKDGKGTKGTNPIPSLLAAPNGAQLQWLVEWFGLLSDEEEASKLGVQRFPLELVRNDPNLKDGLIISSQSLCRLVLKHARPRVLAAGMPLLADAAEISEHPRDRFDIASGAAAVLARCATKRLLKVCWTTFLALLQGESVDQAAETGPLVVVLDLDSTPAESHLKIPLCLSARLTARGAVVAVDGSAQRHSLLKVLSRVRQVK